MQKNKEKKFLNGTETYDELVERITYCGDFLFWYKGRKYNITIYNLPCITVVCEGTATWLANIKEYNTYEELLLKHKFDDGVSLLEYLASEDYTPA